MAHGAQKLLSISWDNDLVFCRSALLKYKRLPQDRKVQLCLEDDAEF